MTALSDSRAAAFAAEATFQSFAWMAARSRTGTIKAIGSGEQAGQTLYGQDAERVLSAATSRTDPQTQAPLRHLAKTGAAAAGRGASAVYRTARAFDLAAGRSVAWGMTQVGRLGLAAASKLAGTWFARGLKLIDDVALGGFLNRSGRRAIEKLRSVRHYLVTGGLIKGGLAGLHRFIVPYFRGSFRRNRKKYGLTAAIAMETATILLDIGLRKAAPIVGGVVGYQLGGTSGAALGTIAGAWTAKGVNYATRILTSGTAGSAARGVVETLPARVQRILADRSDVRARRRAGGKLIIDPSGQAVGSALPKIAAQAIRRRKRTGKPVPQDLLSVRRLSEVDGRSQSFGLELVEDVKRQLAGLAAVSGRGRVEVTDDQVLAAILASARLTSEQVRAAAANGFEAFAWKQGPRGGRYWLPDGKPDEPKHRQYGKRAEASAAKQEPAKKPAAASPAPESKLPKTRKRLTIQQADAALKQKGYKRIESGFDLATKTSWSVIEKPDGSRVRMSADEITKLVYEGAKPAAPGSEPHPDVPKLMDALQAAGAKPGEWYDRDQAARAMGTGLQGLIAVGRLVQSGHAELVRGEDGRSRLRLTGKREGAATAAPEKAKTPAPPKPAVPKKPAPKPRANPGATNPERVKSVVPVWKELLTRDRDAVGPNAITDLSVIRAEFDKATEGFTPRDWKALAAELGHTVLAGGSGKKAKEGLHSVLASIRLHTLRGSIIAEMGKPQPAKSDAKASAPKADRREILNRLESGIQSAIGQIQKVSPSEMRKSNKLDYDRSQAEAAFEDLMKLPKAEVVEGLMDALEVKEGEREKIRRYYSRLNADALRQKAYEVTLQRIDQIIRGKM